MKRLSSSLLNKKYLMPIAAFCFILAPPHQKKKKQKPEARIIFIPITKWYFEQNCFIFIWLQKHILTFNTILWNIKGSLMFVVE